MAEISTTATRPVRSTVDITAAPRVVITLATGLVTRIFDLPSARDNAWQCVLADRERAAQRAEIARVLRRAK